MLSSLVVALAIFAADPVDPSSAVASEPIPIQPRQPVFATVTVNETGQVFTLETMATKLVPQTETYEAEADGKKVTRERTVMKPVHETKTRPIAATGVEVYTAEGMPIPPEQFGAYFAKPVAALVSPDSRKVDPFYLDFFQYNTLVLVPRVLPDEPERAEFREASDVGAPRLVLGRVVSDKLNLRYVHLVTDTVKQAVAKEDGDRNSVLVTRNIPVKRIAERIRSYRVEDVQFFDQAGKPVERSEAAKWLQPEAYVLVSATGGPFGSFYSSRIKPKILTVVPPTSATLAAEPVPPKLANPRAR